MIYITYDEVSSIWKNFERAKKQYEFDLTLLNREDYIEVVCRKLQLVKYKHRKQLENYYKIYKGKSNIKPSIRRVNNEYKKSV